MCRRNQSSLCIALEIAFILLFLNFNCTIAAQTSASTAAPAPSAIAAAQLFIAASGGQSSVSGFSASGTANVWIGVDQQTASVEVASAGPQYTFAQFQSAQETFTEIHALDARGNLAGQWSHGANSGPIPYRNLCVGSSWFFPLFTSLAQVSDSTLTFSYIGYEDWHGVQALHVKVTKTASLGPKLPPSFFSTEYYLDPHTYLLAGMAGTLSPDDGSSAQIAMEVRYSNYVAQEGVLVPMHVEQYLNGTLLRQITLNSVQINSAVPQSLFQIGQ